MTTRPPEAKKLKDGTATLSASDIQTARVDRRSFLAKTVIAGAIGVSAAMTAACPSSGGDGTDSDSDSQ